MLVFFTSVWGHKLFTDRPSPFPAPESFLVSSRTQWTYYVSVEVRGQPTGISSLLPPLGPVTCAQVGLVSVALTC